MKKFLHKIFLFLVIAHHMPLIPSNKSTTALHCIFGLGVDTKTEIDKAQDYVTKALNIEFCDIQSVGSPQKNLADLGQKNSQSAAEKILNLYIKKNLKENEKCQNSILYLSSQGAATFLNFINGKSWKTKTIDGQLFHLLRHPSCIIMENPLIDAEHVIEKKAKLDFKSQNVIKNMAQKIVHYIAKFWFPEYKPNTEKPFLGIKDILHKTTVIIICSLNDQTVPAWHSQALYWQLVRQRQNQQNAAPVYLIELNTNIHMGTLNMNLEIDNKKIMVGNILSCILQKINLVKANNVKIEQNIATNLAPIASQYKKIKEFIKNKKAVIQPVVSKFFKKFNFSKLNLNDFKIDKKIQTHMQYLGLKTKSVVSDISKKLDTFVESTFNIDQTIETNMKPDASKYEEIGKYFERKAEVGKKTSY